MTRSDDAHDPDAPPAAPSSDSPTGELLKRLAAHGLRSPRYKLEGEIARGGMGAILRVWDEDVRRHLAMKVILGKTDSPGEQGTPQVDAKTLARFLEEGQVTGQLDHPGIVPVHELGLDADGRVYFTMKLVKGRDLRQIFELVFAGTEGWTQTRALGVVLKACEALAYAHKKGVIHRDLKPANVMVGNFGEVYVMDWGLARVLDRKDTHDIRLAPEFASSLTSVHSERREERDDAPDSPLVTMDGDVMGTPAYMPPEQARGEIEKLSPRSDVYSIGAVLYHLLARQLPYVAPGVRMTNRTVLARLLDGPPRPLHELRPEVPSELVAICEKAMSREAERRYADTLALAEDLQAFLEGRVVHAYETGAVAELRKWVARNKGIALASAAALLVAIGGLAWVSIVQSGARQAISDKNTELEKTNADLARAKTTAETNERAAKQQSYVANIAAADASLRANELTEVNRRLQACDDGMRGWEWKRLMLQTDSSLQVLRGHEDVVASVAFNRDGSLLASGSWDRTIRVWDLASKECRFVLRGHELAVSSVAFSPNGARIASASADKTIRIWNAANGECLQVLHGHKAQVSGVAFSPDGARIGSSSYDGTVQLWNAADGESLRVMSAGDELLDSVTFSPDGSRVAAHAEDGVREWDTSSGELVGRPRGPRLQAFTTLAYSPDGAWIAACVDLTVTLRRPSSGADLRVLRGHQRTASAVAFNPDGARLVSGSEDATLRVWDTSSGEGLLVLRGHLRGVDSVAYDPDGSRIASGSWDATVRVWSSALEQNTLVLQPPRAVRPVVAFSPDGSRLAMASDGGGACVWNSRTGEQLLALERTWFNPALEIMGPVSVAFSADGSRVAAAELLGTVHVWSAIDGKSQLELRGHDEPVGGVAFSPDGTRLATASADSTIRVWDSATGETLRVLRGHSANVNSVVFDRHGTHLASASEDKSVRVWDAATGQTLLELHGHDEPVSNAVFSPDGSRIASASEDKTVRVWSATTGESLLVLRGHDHPVYSVEFSPDGSRLVSGSHDKTVRIWDSTSGECLYVLRGHTEAVRCATFSPDGSRIATAASDTSVRVWETSASVAQDPARAVVAAAASLVPLLFEPLALVGDVEERLQADTSLSEEVRTIALRLVRVHGNNPTELNKASWEIVKQPRGERPGYERALRAMQAACAGQSGDGLILNTLGVAQYRTGRFEEALATLTRSDELNQRKQPGDVAFLAMAQHQLGHTQAARTELARLRELMLEPEWSAEAEAQAFFAEAEDLITGAK